MARSSQLLTVALHSLSGILLVSSGIWVGMVLPQQAQPQPQPETNISPTQPASPTPPILPTLAPPQANPPVASPTADADPEENHESPTDLEAEIREIRQQVIQLLIRIEELESRLQRLRSQTAPEPVRESSTAAEIAPGAESASAPTPAPTTTPTSFQVGTQTISLPGDLLFDFDKAEIRPEAASLLAQVAKSLEAMPGARVQVNGHTDNIGPLNYNLAIPSASGTKINRFTPKMPSWWEMPPALSIRLPLKGSALPFSPACWRPRPSIKL